MSWYSAFVADGTGTNGAGINALVFGAGGDIQAESILKRMTTFALNASNNLVPLKVEFNYYRKNGEVLETYRYDGTQKLLKNIQNVSNSQVLNPSFVTLSFTKGEFNATSVPIVLP